MIVRLVGLGLLALAAAVGWFFLWLPLQAGTPDGTVLVRIKAFVFVSFAGVIGLVLAGGGSRALAAFQPSRTRAQTAFVLAVIVVAGVFAFAGWGWYRERALPASDVPPAEVLRAFYRQRAAEAFYGLPDPAQLAKLSPHLSSGLASALARARDEQLRCRDAFPNDIPPWSQGDLFTSHFEGHTRLDVREVTPSNFDLLFEYRAGTARFDWRDRALMRRERGRWVIDDLWYRSEAEFASGYGASLRNALAARGC